VGKRKRNQKKGTWEERESRQAGESNELKIARESITNRREHGGGKEAKSKGKGEGGARRMISRS